MLNLESAITKIEQRSVRQFYLINDIGEVFDLTSRLDDPNVLNVGFLNNPTNLGFTFTDEYYQLYHYNVLSGRTWVNPDINGELIFRSYDQHSSFEYFVAHTSRLYLGYVAPFSSTQNSQVLKIYAECSITSAPNSEIKFEDSLIRIDLSIHLLEPMKSIKNVVEATDLGDGDGTKTYPYSYDINGTSYKYGSKNGSFIVINNLGTAPTFPKIILYGPATAPTLTIQNYNTGEVLQVVAIDYSLGVNDVLEFNSDPLDQWLTINGLNGYDYMNKNLDTYLVIPPGKHIITLTGEQGRMEVEYEYKFY